MNLVTHNPEFSTGCSITELLSRVTTQASQLDSAKKQIVVLINQIGSARKRIVALTSENTDHIKQKTEMREQFAKEKTALVEENTAYLQRIKELERSAALDSTNSCKPPSSDGLRKPNGKKDKNKKADKDKKKRTNRREKSGRKSGGQPGHKGRTLKQVDEPDEIIDILPCPKCGILRKSVDRFLTFPRLLRLLLPSIVRHGEEFKGEFPANVTQCNIERVAVLLPTPRLYK